MNTPYQQPQQFGGGGSDNGPPGQNLLGICLAGAAAVLGTPYLFHFIGPFVEELIRDTYGSEDLASVMYFASFAFCGVAIFALCRLILWYVLAALVAFLSVRAAGVMAV